MAKFSYESYGGPEGFLALVCHSSDEAAAGAFANALVSRNVRVFLAMTGTDAVLPEEIAGAILNARGVLLFTTPDAVESLEFRNAANYAMTLKKPALVIKDPGHVPAHGLDMQLANVTAVPLSGAEETAQAVEETGILSEAVTGEGQIRRPTSKKRILITAALFLLAAGFLVLSVFVIRDRLKYYNSPEYLLRDLDDVEVMNLNVYGTDAIPYIEGHWFRFLDASHMGLTDLSILKNVEYFEIDVSGNPDITSFEPLAERGWISIVRISQDQVPLASVLRERGFTVIVTE